VKLPDERVEAFDMVVQWIYTGNVVPPRNLQDWERVNFFNLFLGIAERLVLLGPFDKIYEQMQSKQGGIDDLGYESMLGQGSEADSH